MYPIKRILGLVITIVAVMGILIGALGAFAVRAVLDGFEGSAEDTFAVFTNQIDNTEFALTNLNNIVTEVGNSLDSVEASMISTSDAISGTRPVLDGISVVMTDTLPTTVETIQAVLPNLINTASGVDSALKALSEFNINESLLGTTIDIPDLQVLGRTVQTPDITLPAYDFNYDLGIEYDPDRAFDDSLIGIEGDLDGVPDQFRVISARIDATSADLDLVSQNTRAIASDIGAIGSELEDTHVAINNYLNSVSDSRTSIDEITNLLVSRISTIKLVATVICLWLALTHLAPLYIGMGLLFGDHSDDDGE